MKAPQQVEMPFVEPTLSTEEQAARAEKIWERRVLPVLAAAIHRLTLKECAELFDARPSYISDALATGEQRREEQRKRPPIPWLVALLVGAPEATKLELLTVLCGVAGYRAPERARQLTDREELRLRRAATRRLAPALADIIDREIEES